MIRMATVNDLSRIAEIYVFINRLQYFPIFKDANYSFGEMQVMSIIENYFSKEDVLKRLYVYDDGLVKGFVEIKHQEICKLYVDPFMQSKGIGSQLINYAIESKDVSYLWALEKNTRAVAFYQKHGFELTNEKCFEEGTSEYLVKLVRKKEA